ncbi:hypothetical protein [Candidatus Sneabacter namystus]|uniref:Uncharacterized protein n=1 Tax=Candidatus Sneabacter namystus TaxID=2601646 RepID=A0A5C0UH01_9RICK|nr:hypothetical protein [Candidatus Sneabacter namystus]QEK39406.1 hypothetical protein FZC37_00410 [Candidatus Sneabacter namystus]
MISVKDTEDVRAMLENLKVGGPIEGESYEVTTPLEKELCGSRLKLYGPLTLDGYEYRPWIAFTPSTHCADTVSISARYGLHPEEEENVFRVLSNLSSVLEQDFSPKVSVSKTLLRYLWYSMGNDFLDLYNDLACGSRMKKICVNESLEEKERKDLLFAKGVFLGKDDTGEWKAYNNMMCTKDFDKSISESGSNFHAFVSYSVSNLQGLFTYVEQTSRDWGGKFSGNLILPQSLVLLRMEPDRIVEQINDIRESGCPVKFHVSDVRVPDYKFTIDGPSYFVGNTNLLTIKEASEQKIHNYFGSFKLAQKGITRFEECVSDSVIGELVGKYGADHCFNMKFGDDLVAFSEKVQAARESDSYELQEKIIIYPLKELLVEELDVFPHWKVQKPHYEVCTGLPIKEELSFVNKGYEMSPPLAEERGLWKADKPFSNYFSMTFERYNTVEVLQFGTSFPAHERPILFFGENFIKQLWFAEGNAFVDLLYQYGEQARIIDNSDSAQGRNVCFDDIPKGVFWSKHSGVWKAYNNPKCSQVLDLDSFSESYSNFIVDDDWSSALAVIRESSHSFKLSKIVRLSQYQVMCGKSKNVREDVIREEEQSDPLRLVVYDFDLRFDKVKIDPVPASLSKFYSRLKASSNFVCDESCYSYKHKVVELSFKKANDAVRCSYTDAGGEFILPDQSRINKTFLSLVALKEEEEIAISDSRGDMYRSALAGLIAVNTACEAAAAVATSEEDSQQS